jgi:hypothetical protein
MTSQRKFTNSATLISQIVIVSNEISDANVEGNSLSISLVLFYFAEKLLQQSLHSRILSEGAR